ncbi:MAG: anaerobic ribonucleoside-triphosphate reductase activating protein [Victivallaceae bacterium]|nr:anaerobic ribonucleoside-triphosphate reductase activating protein [Victivallaceae bacterium]
MAIHGLRKFSLIDYPGKLACVVFFGGCNFRCPFCHNAVLVVDPGSQPEIPLETLRNFFNARRGRLDGVVFSGGEPTLAPELERCCQAARDAELSVRIDTNASSPDILTHLHRRVRIDSLGIDFKTPFERYVALTNSGDVNLPEKIRSSIQFALHEKIDLEVRTTVHRALLSVDDLRKMHRQLQSLGVKRWVLQQFHRAELLDEALNAAPTYSDAELGRIAVSLGPEVTLRGALRIE